MNPDLLKDLCCPETRQPLREASSEMMTQVRECIRAGGLRNRAGQVVDRPFEGGLLREDGSVLYPVRDGLPILLIAEGIPMTNAG